MNTGLTSNADQTIINLAHAFDGYAYVEREWPTAGGPDALRHQWSQLQETGRLFSRSENNFAINFYLHRTFHHWGYLPEAKTSDWYSMAFLYLHLYRLPVPESYRHPSLYQGWASRPQGSAEVAAAEIRQALRRG